ncbi:hypothetical protein Tco_0959838 [Tanacetum coccineum]
MQVKKKVFKFANFITGKEEFIPTITQKLGGTNEGCNMFKIVKNLRGLKRDLKRLSWKDGDVFENVSKLRYLLKDVQIRIDKDPHNKELRNEECVVLKKYANAMKYEEHILYQKAKVKRLSMGDRNNAYFYKAIQSRIQRNKVDVINDENGNRVEGPDVANVFVNHLKMFLGESIQVERLDEMEDLINYKLNIGEASHMCRASVIGKDVCLVVKEFLDTDKLVSKNQSAFVPKRHIQDNIMLAQELFKGYDRKMRPKRVALKVDIQKDYDIVNCFSICVNGVSCGYFSGGRQKVDQCGDFKYHYGCKRLKITNVCFADDLLLFCHADKASIRVLKDAIEDFRKVEKLPISFRINSCVLGLCLLITSWSDNDINKLLKGFLWNHSYGSKGRANVAWKNVCKDKQKGGLRLKDLCVWNKAMTVKHLWHIASYKESLWVKWINTKKLKGKSIWEIDEEKDDS